MLRIVRSVRNVENNNNNMKPKKKRKRINVVGIKAFTTKGMSFNGCLNLDSPTLQQQQQQEVKQ